MFVPEGLNLGVKSKISFFCSCAEHLSISQGRDITTYEIIGRGFPEQIQCKSEAAQIRIIHVTLVWKLNSSIDDCIANGLTMLLERSCSQINRKIANEKLKTPKLAS